LSIPDLAAQHVVLEALAIAELGGIESVDIERAPHE
jgi:hypothetical protein